MVFIGKEGALLDKLKALASGLKVLFLVNIPREDTVAAYHSADIFIFGSYIEASPLVIIEAKASKTPFVTTDCGNVREWKGGIVCNADDMSVNVNKILNDKSLRKGLAEEGLRNGWNIYMDIVSRQI
jgi:glycosyltransferase involved in cell wall biosynthesis